jgi:tripartite ATP-independent transporter DctP family solute receptor
LDQIAVSRKWRKKMKKLLLVVLIVLAVSSFTMAGGRSEGPSVREFRWYHPEPYGHPWTDVGQMIADEVWRRSDGRLKITLYPAGSLGSQADAIDQLRVGSLDFLTSGPTILNPFDEKVMVFGVPYLFRDRDHAYRVMDQMGDELFNTHILEQSGIRTIALWYFGTRTLTINADQPVMRPSDLAGKNVRAMTIPVYSDAVASLGASPTPVDFTELYMALQTGVVQGQENPVPTIYAQRFHEVQSQIVLTNHTVHMGSVHVSERVWRTISEDDRDLILEVFAEYKPEIDQRIDQQSVRLLEEMREAGTRIVEPDTAAFRAHSEAHMNRIYGARWGDLIRRIKAIQ